MRRLGSIYAKFGHGWSALCGMRLGKGQTHKVIVARDERKSSARFYAKGQGTGDACEDGMHASGNTQRKFVD